MTYVVTVLCVATPFLLLFGESIAARLTREPAAEETES